MSAFKLTNSANTPLRVYSRSVDHGAGGNVMLVVKTVKVPIHYDITTRKLSILDSLTARTTYGVWSWSTLFKEHGLKGSYTDRRLFHECVKEQAELSGAMAQCCFDTAAWMWRSYREAHKAWRREVAIARREGDKKRLRNSCGENHRNLSQTE